MDNIVGLQTQRHLEFFFARIGIPQINTEPVMSFSFPDHELHLQLNQHQLLLTLIIPTAINDEHLLMLFQRVIPGLTTKHLYRPLRINGAAALNISLSEEIQGQQLLMIYREMLRLLAPWKKRI